MSYTLHQFTGVVEENISFTLRLVDRDALTLAELQDVLRRTDWVFDGEKGGCLKIVETESFKMTGELFLSIDNLQVKAGPAENWYPSVLKMYILKHILSGDSIALRYLEGYCTNGDAWGPDGAYCGYTGPEFWVEREGAG